MTFQQYGKEYDARKPKYPKLGKENIVRIASFGLENKYCTIESNNGCSYNDLLVGLIGFGYCVFQPLRVIISSL